MKRFTTILALLLSLNLTLIFTGCGGDKAEPETTPTTQAPTEATPDAPAEPVKEANAVQALLAHTPDTAQATVVLPNIQGLFDQVTALYKRMEDPAVVEERINEFITELALEANALEAESLEELFAAKGIAGDQPVAIYADLSPTFQDAEAEAAWTIALVTQNQEQALAALKADLIDEIPELNTQEPATEEVNGATLTTYGEYGYATQDNNLFLGFTHLIKGILEQQGNPRTTDYDSVIEAQDDHILVAAFNLPALGELMTNVPDEFFEDDEEKTYYNTFIPSINASFKDAAENATATITAQLNDEQLALRTYINDEELPGIAAVYGDASPLRFTNLLPEATRIYLSLRFNDETRTYVKESIAPAVTTGTAEDDTEAAQTLSMANQAIDMIGEELTLAIIGKDGGLPGVALMIALNEHEISQSLLQMLVPASDDETITIGEGDTATTLAIHSVLLPDFPFPLSIAYPKDTVVASTDKAALKSIATQIITGETGSFLESRTPPIDPAAPTYNSLYLDTKLVSEITMLIAMFGGPEAAEALEDANTILPVLRELRLNSITKDDWHVTNLEILLNPEAEAPAAQESETAPTE